MRFCLLMGLSAVLVLVAADPCFAAGGERSMFEKALDLGIWTLVVFLLLLFILTKYAWKPMLAGLAQRERDIASAVEAAQKAKEEAAELHRQLAAERQKGHDQVRQMIEEARKAADQLKEQAKVEIAATSQAERERLQREIEIARHQLYQEGFSRLAELASLISSRAIRRNLTPDDHRGLVDEALAELNQGARA